MPFSSSPPDDDKPFSLRGELPPEALVGPGDDVPVTGIRNASRRFGPRWSLGAPEDPLRYRHEVLAYMVASGASNVQVADELGITAHQVHQLTAHPKVISAIEAFKEKYFASGLSKRIAASVPKAMDAMEEFIANAVPGQKAGERLDAAKWMLEKFSGKPRQEVDLDGGGTILQLLRALDERKTKALASADTIDVTAPQEEAPKDPLKDWLDTQEKPK